MQDKKDENQYIKQYIQILNFELWPCVLHYTLYANIRIGVQSCALHLKLTTIHYSLTTILEFQLSLLSFPLFHKPFYAE
jgi:hypothetical protein